MITQGQYRALIGYIIIFVLAIFGAGCSGGETDNDDDGGNGGGTDNSKTERAAIFLEGVDKPYRPYPIFGFRVDETVILDYYEYWKNKPDPSAWVPLSFEGELVTYNWSFSYKPDLSDAELQVQSSTDYMPSFVADKRGTYMVQLVLSVAGASSERSITTVIVEYDDGSNPTGPKNHQGLSSKCVQCHNNGAWTGGLVETPKSGDHVATSNVCEACHTAFGFDIIPYTDHSELFGNCKGCHDTGLAVGKSSYHEPTEQECDACHNTISFLTLVDGYYDHTSVNRPCIACHNGIVAIGKHDKHPPSSDVCNSCHNVTDFESADMDHENADSCGDSLCHLQDKIDYLPHPEIYKDYDCIICHDISGWALNGDYDHTAIDYTVQRCDSCHNNVDTPSAVGTDSKPGDPHIQITDDCGACHNIDNFGEFFENHSGFTDGCTLEGCHVMPDPDMHIPMPDNIGAYECVLCHTPGNTFSGADFDHVETKYIAYPTCEVCHDGVKSVGLPEGPGLHLPFDPPTQDCDDCHDSANTDTFEGATVDHTAGSLPACIDCHNGDGATGKPTGWYAHIPADDDCASCHAYDSTIGFENIDEFANVHTIDLVPCKECHNRWYARRIGITRKPNGNHIPTNDDCGVCHKDMTDFAGLTFDHAGITDDCNGCHNGSLTTGPVGSRRILGKPTGQYAHVPTDQDCALCHDLNNSTTNWVESKKTLADWAHEGIANNCDSCHDGNYSDPHPAGAKGPPDTLDHTDNPDIDCGFCHKTSVGDDPDPEKEYLIGVVSFLNVFTNHSTLVADCTVGCHSADLQIALDLIPDLHPPTNENDCEDCHTAGGTFKPAVFDHTPAQLNGKRCDDCHDGIYATGMDDKPEGTHIDTLLDCIACHDISDTFAGAWDHTGIVDNCDECHDGGGATGKPGDHVPTNTVDCVACHSVNNITKGFDEGTFDHEAEGIDNSYDDCAGCHDNDEFNVVPSKPGNHSYTEDCGFCHSIETFQGATFNHNGVGINDTCGDCHGVTATPKKVGHMDTDRDCHFCHRDFASFKDALWVHDDSTSVRCDTCHGEGGGASVQPTQGRYGHFITKPNQDCRDCHISSNGKINPWKAKVARSGSSGFHHTAKWPLYPGDHGSKATCLECHRLNDQNITSYPSNLDICARCHKDDFRQKGPHKDGDAGDWENCSDGDCHKPSHNRWKDAD